MSSDLADLIANSADLVWLDDAACADMDPGDFFVDAGHTIKPETLNVCRRCPVRAECLKHAYAHGISGGYFGGTSPGQRRTLSLEEALEYIANDPPVEERRRR